MSVISQIIYLTFGSDLSDPTMSTQAKALFGLSIALSTTSLVMGLTIFFLRGTFLAEDNKQEQDAEAGGSREPAEIESGIEQQHQNLTYTSNPLVAASTTAPRATGEGEREATESGKDEGSGDISGGDEVVEEGARHDIAQMRGEENDDLR